MSETDVMHEIMVEATRLGHRLLRNNVGKAVNLNRDGTARWTAYGVGGKGSSDLQGFTRVWMYPWDNVNGAIASPRRLVPVATYIETKYAKGPKRKEQERFIDGMLQFGCIAGFCFSVADYHKLIGFTETI